MDNGQTVVGQFDDVVVGFVENDSRIEADVVRRFIADGFVDAMPCA